MVAFRVERIGKAVVSKGVFEVDLFSKEIVFWENPVVSKGRRIRMVWVDDGVGGGRWSYLSTNGLHDVDREFLRGFHHVDGWAPDLDKPVLWHRRTKWLVTSVGRVDWVEFAPGEWAWCAKGTNGYQPFWEVWVEPE